MASEFAEAVVVDGAVDDAGVAPKLVLTAGAAAAVVLLVAVAVVLLVAVEGAGAEEPKLNPPVAVAVDAVVLAAAVEGAPNKVEGAVAAPDGAAAGAPKVKPILLYRCERSIVACLSPCHG